MVLILQATLMWFIVTRIVWRSATIVEIGRSLGVTLVLLVLVGCVGRWVAALPRPYDEWLTLDITA